MECPYCLSELPENDQSYSYCIICRKPFIMNENGSIQRQIITLKQQISILLIGLAIYFIFYYLYKDINLGFSITFYLAFAAAFTMGYRVFHLFFKSNHLFVKDYFPRNKEFFIILAFVLLISVIFINTMLGFIDSNLAIPYDSIPNFSTQFLIGYIIGLFFIIGIYYYYGSEKVRKKNFSRNDRV